MSYLRDLGRALLALAVALAIALAIVTVLVLAVFTASAVASTHSTADGPAGQPKNSIDLLVRPYWVGRSKGGPAATFLVGMYNNEKVPYSSDLRIVTTEDGIETIPVIMKSTVRLLPVKGEAHWKATIYPQTIYLWRFVVRLTNAQKFCFGIVADNGVVGRQLGGTARKSFCLER